MTDELQALFKDAMDWGRSYGQRLNLSDITVADVSAAYAEKARAALSAAQAAVVSVGWISFDDREPPRDAAKDDKTVTAARTVLVTNNIDALNRMGRQSHVWYAVPIKENGGKWCAYDEADRKLWDLTHWFDPFATPPQTAPAVQADARSDRKLSALVLELAEAVDNAAEDIGGSRPQLEILREAVQIAARTPANKGPMTEQQFKDALHAEAVRINGGKARGLSFNADAFAEAFKICGIVEAFHEISGAPTETDSARLDWIEQNVCNVVRLAHDKLRIDWWNGVGQVMVGPNDHPTWRSAIDAAMSQEKES